MKTTVLSKCHSFTLAAFLFAGAVPFVNAADIKLVQGILPPYGIETQNSGIEVDIVRAALAKRGHNVIVHFVPFGRVGKEFSVGKMDAATPLTPASGVKAAYSDSHITYQNVVTTLKEADHEMNGVADLASLRVIAFVNARVFLGEEFALMAKSNRNYREVADQITQNKLLMKGRADAVVGDVRIFKYYNKQIASHIDLKEVVFHGVFAPTQYNVAFQNPVLRDDFNAGLKVIKANGEYEKIISKYVSN